MLSAVSVQCFKLLQSDQLAQSKAAAHEAHFTEQSPRKRSHREPSVHASRRPGLQSWTPKHSALNSRDANVEKSVPAAARLPKVKITHLSEQIPVVPCELTLSP